MRMESSAVTAGQPCIISKLSFIALGFLQYLSTLIIHHCLQLSDCGVASPTTLQRVSLLFLASLASQSVLKNWFACRR